jgi:hypothetical protein
MKFRAYTEDHDMNENDIVEEREVEKDAATGMTLPVVVIFDCGMYSVEIEVRDVNGTPVLWRVYTDQERTNAY